MVHDERILRQKFESDADRTRPLSRQTQATANTGLRSPWLHEPVPHPWRADSLWLAVETIQNQKWTYDCSSDFSKAYFILTLWIINRLNNVPYTTKARKIQATERPYVPTGLVARPVQKALTKNVGILARPEKTARTQVLKI